MIGIFRMAGLNIRIDSMHSFVQTQCAAYQSDGVPDLAVHTDREDIEREREKSAQEDRRTGAPVFAYKDSDLESLAVYRKIAEKLPDYDGFLFHGSAIAVDGCCYLFTAKSGTGKSTHARLWRQFLGSRAIMVNDDKPIIRFLDGAAYVFGTPWDGKHHLSANISAPLKAVCILEQSPENRIREITEREALPILIQQTYRPADPIALAKTLALLDQLNVRFYRLGCNMDVSAAKLAYDTMKEEKASPLRRRWAAKRLG